jgi:hypothetical protein
MNETIGSAMSRVIDRAPVAVTSDGDVRLNVARFDVPKRIEEIAGMARRQGGAVLIGVALSPAEVTRLLDEATMILPNAAGPMVARRAARSASPAVTVTFSSSPPTAPERACG